MIQIRETAAQRRAREAVEARDAEIRWEREKPARLLRAMACATDLGVNARVFHRGEVLCYSFTFDESLDDVWKGDVSGLEEWRLDSIIERMMEIKESNAKKERLRDLRKAVLDRLTPEEREALGLI